MMRAATIALFLWPAGVFSQSVPEPDDFRTGQYRSAVPETLQGATVVDGDAAFALWKTGVVTFIDVLPRAPKPTDLPEDTIWHEKPHISIPGAVWLPNVGYGQLAAITDAYFRSGLNTATYGNFTQAVVFFCRSECWMSWNAAKRAQSYGYTRVFWFPGGTDDWETARYPMVELTPVEGY